MATRKKTMAKKAARKTPARKAVAKKNGAAKPTITPRKPKDPVAALLAKTNSESIRRFSDHGTRGEVVEVISCGIDVIDRYVFGCSDPSGKYGLPVGRASEIYSEEGAGKTSFLLKCLAACQEQGGIAAIAENESSLDPRWAKHVHGLNMDNLILIDADCMEDTTARIIEVILSTPPSCPILIGWDSIAATPTRAEIDGIGDDDDDDEDDTGRKKKKKRGSRVGDRARLLSLTCRQLAGILKAHRAHLMFVNQVRDKIGVMFGEKTTTPGGHAVKFYSSLRCQLRHAGAVKAKNEHSGKDVSFLCTKNKLSIPWRKAVVRLDYASGWNDQWSTLAHAMDHNIIPARSKGTAAYETALAKLDWPLREAEL